MEQLKFSELLKSWWLDKLPDLVLLLDEKEIIVYANRPSIEWLGKDELLGNLFRHFVHERDLERLPDSLSELANLKVEERPWEIRLRQTDGQWHFMSGAANALNCPDFQGLLLTLRPIGQPSRFGIAPQWDLTRLEKQVLEAQAREQESLARELHDSILPHLNGITMLASSIRRHLARSGAVDPQQLDRLVDFTQQAAEQTRAISHGLHPVGIERNSLTTALQLLASTTEILFNVRCTFAYEQPVLVSEREKATHLYRLVQEAVFNAIRHGQAQHVLIGLATNAQARNYLTIKDDGIGISDAALKEENGGLGFNSMRYRAETIGGKLEIERDSNGGTIVTCTFEGDAPPLYFDGN